MRKLLLICVFLSVFCLQGFSADVAEAGIDWDGVVTKFQKQFALVLKNYDKIWHEGYPDLTVQFSNGKRAWELSAKSLREYPKDEKPRFLNRGFGFSDVSKDEKPILQIVLEESVAGQFFRGVSIKDGEKDAFESRVREIIGRFVYHEAFHFYVQSKLHLKNKSGAWRSGMRMSRDTVYPVQPFPRIYRANLYKTLVKAYEDSANLEKHLSDAKYWFNKYNEDFAEEARSIRNTDRDEGTARYVERMADAYVNLGFKSDSSAIKNFLLSKMKETVNMGAVDAESYELGFVAGALMDVMKISWKRDVTDKKGGSKTPLDILFEKIMPSEEEPDITGDWAGKLFEAAEKKNKELAPLMESFLAFYKGKSKEKFLALPRTASSFRVLGMYKHQRVDEAHSVLTGYNKVFRGKGGMLTVQRANVFVVGERLAMKTPCGYFASGLVPMTPENAKRVKITASTYEKTSKKGIRYVCIEKKQAKKKVKKWVLKSKPSGS